MLRVLAYVDLSTKEKWGGGPETSSSSLHWVPCPTLKLEGGSVYDNHDKLRDIAISD